MKDKRNILIIALVVFLMGVGLPAVSSAVIVSAECAYSADILICEIYADTESVSLLSGGVRLNYNAAELTPVLDQAVAYAGQKNENDWYFGSQASPLPYMDPEQISEGGSSYILYIVGKLDEASPSAGVNDPRVLIGSARFTHTNTLPADFGLSLGLGRTAASFVNFVDDAGNPLDDTTDVSFGPVTIRQLGDANSDPPINVQDMGAVRFYMVNGGDSHPWMDCNADGTINIQDMGCIRYIMTH